MRGGMPRLTLMTTPALLRDIKAELTTPRLQLRVPRAGDGTIVHAAVVETLDLLRQWPASLPWAQAEPSVEVSESWCRLSAAWFMQRTTLNYLAFDSAGELVASIGLHDIDWAVPSFEIGYWGRKGYQGQGLMREAAGALVRYAFAQLGARRVSAWTDEANVASRRLCEAIGMQLEGILRHERITPDGQLRNSCVYAAVG